MPAFQNTATPAATATAKPLRPARAVFVYREDAAFWAATELSAVSWELAEEVLDWAAFSSSTSYFATSEGRVLLSIQLSGAAFVCHSGLMPGWMQNLCQA